MTATLNGMFNSAPDTPSTVYPDRLIRPLPKRPLRSRLSSDAADSILLPPAPPATQLFYGACATNGDAVNDSKADVQQIDGGRDLSPDSREHHLPSENGVDLDSGDEDGPVVVRRSTGFRGSSLSPTPSSVQQTLPSIGKEQPAKSSSAGPDGYDAFENTNNKKKRKIPTPGNMGSHHSSLSPEFTTLGLANPGQQASTPFGEAGHVSTFYGTGSPASPVGSGMSGSGRGRLGRQGRRSSVHGHVSRAQTRGAGRRDGPLSSPGPTGEPVRNHGIISAAIASAAASAFSSSPYRVSVQGSMLEQQTTPTKTQFTFTCESDSSKGMALHAYNSYSSQHRSPVPQSQAGHGARGFSTQDTQTSPTVPTQMGQQPTAQQKQQQPHQAAASTEPPPGRKKKRSPGSIYALAARQRKIQQQYANFHYPPRLEDIWICEFCEYESIFGHPPEALIRQYEIKDRKERKRLAEKKRLLEKAKMKGRKHKKSTKNPTKHAAAQQATYDQGYDRASVDHSSLGGEGPHNDGFGTEYDDELAAAAPPASPAGTFKPPPPPGSAAKKTMATSSGGRGAIEGATRPP